MAALFVEGFPFSNFHSTLFRSHRSHVDSNQSMSRDVPCHVHLMSRLSIEFNPSCDLNFHSHHNFDLVSRARLCPSPSFQRHSLFIPFDSFSIFSIVVSLFPPPLSLQLFTSTVIDMVLVSEVPLVQRVSEFPTQVPLRCTPSSSSQLGPDLPPRPLLVRPKLPLQFSQL